MKRINNYLILTSLVLVILITSCRTKCRKIINIDIENENVSSYFDFKEESYWIYSDINGTIIDTLVVSEYSNSYWSEDYNDRALYPKCYEVERVSYHLKSLKNNTNLISVIAYPKIDDDGNITAFETTYDDMKYRLYLTLNNSSICIDCSIIDSIDINSVNYNNVYLIDNTILTLYIAKDIGIIKLITKDYNYSLISYKIN